MIAALIVAERINAQISIGGLPPSFGQNFSENIETLVLPSIDVEKLIKEDESQINNARFAVPINVNLGLENAGQWIELENGDRLWRLKITSPTAQGLAMLYDEFWLPMGAKLFVYDEKKEQILGAYTYKNNKNSRKMMTGLIRGETAFLELYEPKNKKGQSHLHIFRIQHAYKSYEMTANTNAPLNDFGFGASLDCEIDINCPQGNNWQDVKRGVCRIIMVLEEGMAYCSGTLINNTNNDGTPYVLSAFHCMDGSAPLYDFWRFDFNYELTDCFSTIEPEAQSIVGCTQRAAWLDSDFLLLELQHPLPQHYNVYFNGWNRNANVPFYSANIHHPRGDVKKIAIDSEPALIFPSPIVWSNNVTTPPSYHFKVEYNQGTFEIGSSGGGLFDHNGRLIGQLHGGNADCEQFVAFFGRFRYSWSSGSSATTRLREWLDPNSTGVSVVDGTNALDEPSISIMGRIHLSDGRGIGGVSVYLDGGVEKMSITDTSGTFLFVELPPNEDYSLQVVKDFNAQNGISTFDLLKVQKHILNIETFDNQYRMIAADANNSASISNFDIIKMRKVLLHIDSSFPDNPSWKFIPDDFIFQDPEHHPYEYSFPPFILIDELSEDYEINFTGIKIGDVNESANPAE